MFYYRAPHTGRQLYAVFCKRRYNRKMHMERKNEFPPPCATSHSLGVREKNLDILNWWKRFIPQYQHKYSSSRHFLDKPIASVSKTYGSCFFKEKFHESFSSPLNSDKHFKKQKKKNFYSQNVLSIISRQKTGQSGLDTQFA